MKTINLQLTKVRKMMKVALAQHLMILQLMKTPPKTVRWFQKNEVVAYLCRNIKMLKKLQYPTRTLTQEIHARRYVVVNSIALSLAQS